MMPTAILAVLLVSLIMGLGVIVGELIYRWSEKRRG